MEKNLKNKRMSLDPAKNPFSAIQRHHNATELDVRQSPHEESQISLSNNDHNPSKDVPIPLLAARGYLRCHFQEDRSYLMR